MTDTALIQGDSVSSLVRHALFGVVGVLGLVGALAYWASTVQIASAIVAQGSIVVQSYPKKVQHQEGGIVAAVHVQNEQVVEAGQLLVTLDDTAIAAGLAALRDQWQSALVREARLLAEIEGHPEFDLPEQLASAAEAPEVVRMIATEQLVFASRRTVQAGRAAQLAEQITQLEMQVVGLETQQQAVADQLLILADELAAVESLQRDRLVEASRVTSLQKQRVQLEGEAGRLVSTIAGARAAIAERKLQVAQLNDDFLTAALDQLQATRRTIADVGEQLRAAEDRLARTEVRAPQAGVVHESIVHTIGGVVGAGDVLMSIVPHNDTLVVTAQLSPMDVDRVAAGQQARLRFSSLDMRSTPELAAIVVSVSPDITQNPATGLAYYTARLAIPAVEVARLPNPAVLTPGMPVETFVQTGERTVLSYLVQPFTDQLARAMRED